MVVKLFIKTFNCFKLVLAIIFPIVTFGAVLFSMYIEAQVCSYLMSAVLAWVVVLILEGAKISLAFYEQGSGQESSLAKRLRKAHWLRVPLAAFSLICTLCFFIYYFWGDVDAKNAQTVEQNQKALDEAYYGETGKIPLLTDEYNKKKEDIRQQYDTSWESGRIKELQSLINSIDVPSDSYTSRLEAIAGIIAPYNDEIAVLTERKRNKEAAADSATAALDKKHEEEKDRAEAEYKSKSSEIQNVTLAESNEGNNPFIHTVLMAICRAFNHETYSKTTYFLVSVAFSLFIAILSELIIWSGASFLSSPSEEIASVLGGIDLIPEDIFRSCLIGIAICGVLFFAFQKKCSIPMIAFIAISYFATFTLSSHLNPPDVPDKKFVSFLLQKVLPSLFNGVLSFGILVIISYFFGDKLTFTDFPSLAVAVGGALGNSLKHA